MGPMKYNTRSYYCLVSANKINNPKETRRVGKHLLQFAITTTSGHIIDFKKRILCKIKKKVKLHRKI